MASKPGERRLQILHTLAEMLETPKGEKITTAALAGRLDCSEAALYRHFASKAQMFEGLIEFIEHSLFAAVYSVESLNFQPKPMLAAYRNLLRVERLSPRRCIMVEDSLANLVTAKTLGMKTVWVSTGLRDSPSVDVKVRSVRELPRHLNRL